MHHGNYRAVVSDETNTVTSSNALIYVLVPPGIVVQPVGVTNLQGETAVFSVIATGAPPLSYRWIRQGLTYVSNAPATLVITNVQPNLSGAFRVTVTNLAGTMNSANVNLLVIPDADTDGLPDLWETNFFGNPTNASASADVDFDGMNNREEYLAGTDPTNTLSVLRLEMFPPDPERAQVVFRFLAISNKNYRLLSTPALDGNWTNLFDIAAHSTNRFMFVTNNASARSGFYKVVIPQ
jgi:hypothetical protein